MELPLEVAYNWRSTVHQNNISNYFNYVIDILFFIDIILNFRTTFYHKSTGEEITNKNLIVKSYLKGNFSVDLISTIPFDLIYIHLFIKDDMAGEGNS